MDGKNMTAIESTGTSSEIKEQYETKKMKKFVGGCFSPSTFMKEMKRKDEWRNSRSRIRGE
jgi:hypothetical protein